MFVKSVHLKAIQLFDQIQIQLPSLLLLNLHSLYKQLNMAYNSDYFNLILNQKIYFNLENS